MKIILDSNEYQGNDELLEIRQLLNEADMGGVSSIYLLSMINEEVPAMVALSRDPVELFLVLSGNRHECYDLLWQSDKALFYDGELGVGNISWLASENILVFYKYYIVHNDLRKVIVCFDSEKTFFIKEIVIDVSEPFLNLRNFSFL